MHPTRFVYDQNPNASRLAPMYLPHMLPQMILPVESIPRTPLTTWYLTVVGLDTSVPPLMSIELEFACVGS